ncbi:MAG: alpha-amylase family protein [Gemmataceae bacterium]|nr:alpha-amylase family protein [Gemmataceae bacterium]
MTDLWYKDAVLYELDVKTYQDGNGDGVGDFRGLLQRLPYLAGLGVTCLWLQPFYPSPNKDDGYDVADYYGVDPRLGTLGDFAEFMHHARERGMRVIADLVVNHTSDQHPWFREARKGGHSPYRDYYIWSKDKPRDTKSGITFPPAQDSVWTYDESAEAYYYHQFYDHQPDLNIANPAVREEVCKVMGFWLDLGLSGFRLDAAPFLCGKPMPRAVKCPDVYENLAEFREFLSWRRGDAIFLAEANVPADEVLDYFGPGLQIHMLFSFLRNQYLFLALARGDAEPLVRCLEKLPGHPARGQWANFLRNHDELDLGALSDGERREVYAAFAPEEGMRAYGRGIRRRLAPMLQGDRRRLELAYSLLFSLPGTPMLRSGDEIGMGEDLSRPERLSVRTPMQWSAEENGGFSTAPPEKLIRPVVSGGDYGYQRVNVATQQRDPGSLLNWMARLIHVRKQCPEIGQGEYKLLKSAPPSVFAHRCEWENGAVLVMHNLADKPAAARADLDERAGEYLVELFGDKNGERVSRTREIDIPGYGSRWFRLGGGHWKLPG